MTEYANNVSLNKNLFSNFFCRFVYSNKV